jgi:hypothetical protein
MLWVPQALVALVLPSSPFLRALRFCGNNAAALKSGLLST